MPVHVPTSLRVFVAQPELENSSLDWQSFRGRSLAQQLAADKLAQIRTLSFHIVVNLPALPTLGRCSTGSGRVDDRENFAANSPVMRMPVDRETAIYQRWRRRSHGGWRLRSSGEGPDDAAMAGSIGDGRHAEGEAETWGNSRAGFPALWNPSRHYQSAVLAFTLAQYSFAINESVCVDFLLRLSVSGCRLNETCRDFESAQIFLLG